MNRSGAVRQVSIERLIDDNQERLGLGGSPAGRAATAC